MCKHECGRATNVAKQRMWQSHECCKATNVAKPRMPSANVFDASRSSIEDCHHMKCVIPKGHHNVLCHPHRGHQSKIVIT
jgi:mitochondrial fission protein ELM1